MAHRKKAGEKTEWARKIIALRQYLGCSQGELGRRINCSAMTVSRWEGAHQAPTAEHYIQLGRVAGSPDCWFFWERAGLRTSDVLRTLPDRVRRKVTVTAAPPMDIAAAGPGMRNAVVDAPPMVSVPLLQVFVGTPGCLGDMRLSLDHVPATKVLGAPRDWCPNPMYTNLVRIKGHSMEPLIRDADIVAVDSFRTDRDELDGKIVLVASEEKGLCVSHFRRYDSVDVLQPENQREYSQIVLKKGSGWEIIGQVLWWITAAP